MFEYDLNIVSLYGIQDCAVQCIQRCIAQGVSYTSIMQELIAVGVIASCAILYPLFLSNAM